MESKLGATVGLLVRDGGRVWSERACAGGRHGGLIENTAGEDDAQPEVAEMVVSSRSG
jgi:hypothetical protein